MQATMNSSALAPSLRLQFARRGTMVRSEKRRRPAAQRPPEEGYERPPRRRRPRAGFFYKLVTVLLLLTLWPIGLILLWRRKLRWSTLTKLFSSIITLMACILLVGFALTVETNNPRYTAMQDSVNSFLDSSVDSMVDCGVRMGERAQRSLEAMEDIYQACREPVLTYTADAIDWGVDLARTVRERTGAFFAGLSGPSEQAEPEAAATPAPTETDGEADAEAAETATPAPTSVPAAEINANADSEELPVYIPETAPDAASGAEVIQGGMLLRSGALDADALPTPTPQPRPEDLRFAVKPAGEATVYFNIGSGKFYHMKTVCGSMKNADTHRFAEVAENIHEPCERCNPPARALLEEPYIVWMDEGGRAHLTDECPSFQGQWSLLAASEANATGAEGCPDCGADRYLAALASGQEVTLTDGSTPAPEVTAEPTPEPTLAPTPEPSPQVVTPRETLKPASEATVYHSSNGKFYHMNDHCSGMTGGSAYTLAQCVADGFERCNACSAPAPEALEQLCLWRDEDGVCHVSDACDYFVGQYALIQRDEALSAGLVGCSHCGAVEYLIPFTVMNTYAAPDGDAQ